MTDPCPACEKLPWAASYGKAGAIENRHLKDLHAEIARLRALLAEYVEWHDAELGVDTPAEGTEPYWLERVRAALRGTEG